MKLTHKISILASIALAGIASVSFAQDPAPAPVKNSNIIMMSGDTLAWQDFKELPGVKMAVLYGDPKKKGPFTVRLKLPAKYKVMAHHHMFLEQDTVINGVINVGEGKKFDETKGTKLSPGSFVAFPSHVAHYFWTDKESVIQISSTGPWGVKYEKGQQQ